LHGAQPSCGTYLAPSAQVAAKVASAPAGSVICLASGDYGALVLSPHAAEDVTLQAAPGAHVATGPVTITGSHLVLRGLWIHGEVAVKHPSSFVTIDRNDITGGYFGINLLSWNCSAPGATSWPGCSSVPAIADVVISGNRIHDIGGSSGEDALHLNNFVRVRITGNEIYGIREGGNHSDCLQTVFGGSDLMFDHNYEHDNQCQGFFIKDGDVTGAVVWDNLFVRDRALHETELNLQVFNTHGLVIRNNTNWSGNADLVRNVGSTVVPTVEADHNVDALLNNGCCSEGTFRLSDGGDNVFAQAPWTFKLAASDRVNSSPSFVDPGHDDYRLAVNPRGIGIDWRPADERYGPTS
jgi:hypothetical protein